MLSTTRRLPSILAATLLTSLGTIGSHFSRIKPPVRPQADYGPFPSRKVRPAKVKGYRTAKAEGVYGRNLRKHFDAHRLTRSQRNRFYAGKAVY